MKNNKEKKIKNKEQKKYSQNLREGVIWKKL